jgi:hypothetical protein
MKRKRTARPQSQESQRAKAAIMEALDNQLRNNDPPETRATYERLKQIRRARILEPAGSLRRKTISL